MGSSVSKSEGECVYSTPKRLPPEGLVITVNPGELGQSLDPRSPHVCRTPINKALKAEPAGETFEMSRIPSPHQLENPSTLLKNKLIKELQYNLDDPRSPSQFINRTPIVFDDSEFNASKPASELSLEDKFTDLFIESCGNEIIQEENKTGERDPRSPTADVQRTPIIFSDDFANEAETLETVLEALTLSKKVHNKHVQRVKNSKRTRSDENPNYQDTKQIFLAPKKAVESFSKRTPLSCVANKTHLRSRSVENKSKRPKLPQTSYDDNTMKHPRVENFGSRQNAENEF